MEVNMHAQLAATLYAIIAGVIMAVLYDLVRALRTVLGTSPTSAIPRRVRSLPGNPRNSGGLLSSVSLNLSDLLYFIFISAAYSVFLFHANYGTVRWYLLGGSALGFAMYRISLCRILMPILDSAAVVIRSAVILSARFAALPFRLAVKALSSLLKLIGKNIIAPINRKRLHRRLVKRTEKIIDRLPELISGKSR